MYKDQVVGAILLAASAVVIIAYVWLVFFPPLAGADILLLKLTGAAAVAGRLRHHRMDRLHPRNNTPTEAYRGDRKGN